MSPGLVFRTLRHLKRGQVTDRIRRTLIRPKARLAPTPPRRTLGSIAPPCGRPATVAGEPGTRLRLYNLHYQDALRAADLSAEDKDRMIRGWIAENPPMESAGWEPYTLSLRTVNWMLWALTGGEADDALLDGLAVQIRAVEDQLERHLLGNHLWANAKALVFAGLFFEGKEADAWLAKGLAIAEAERAEQFLADGGHFELSPTYHQLLTEDLLDLVNIADGAGRALGGEWRDTAARALAWLQVMTRPDGQVPLFNDAAQGVSPPTAELVDYGRRLGISAPPPVSPGLSRLAATGYYRWRAPGLDIWTKMGRIGPDYLPGHAHADCFTFELFARGRPIIVDTGVSTYAPGPLRAYERGTAAHNTVQLADADLAEMWASFRVGRRPDVTGLEVGASSVAAEHDGYARFRARHRRRFVFDQEGVTIEDELTGPRPGTARLHFAPGIEPVVDGLSVAAGPVRIQCDGAGDLRIERCEIARTFGERAAAQCLSLDFSARLVTRIERCASSS